MQTFIHYFLHFGATLIIAYLFFRKEWKFVYLVFVATMLVDLDHLICNDVFDPNRCSIQYHPLHTYYAISLYFVLLFFRKPLRYIGIGLLFHMLTDFNDCLMTYARCRSCLAAAPAKEFVITVANFFGI